MLERRRRQEVRRETGAVERSSRYLWVLGWELLGDRVCSAGFWVKVFKCVRCGHQELCNANGMYGQIDWQMYRVNRSRVVVVILPVHGVGRWCVCVCRCHTSGARGVGCAAQGWVGCQCLIASFSCRSVVFGLCVSDLVEMAGDVGAYWRKGKVDCEL